MDGLPRHVMHQHRVFYRGGGGGSTQSIGGETPIDRPKLNNAPAIRPKYTYYVTSVVRAEKSATYTIFQRYHGYS